MFVAIINQPGYLPEAEPVEFETCAEAWHYLVSELENDSCFADTRTATQDLDGAIAAITGSSLDDTGSVFAGGYVYCVEVAE